MDVLVNRLRKFPTPFLVWYVICADVLLLFGFMPYEYVCLQLLRKPAAGLPFALGILATNIDVLLIMLICMTGSGIVIERMLMRRPRARMRG